MSGSTYPPLGVPKPVVAGAVWVVDGPLIRFGMTWPTMPFPTRATVIRVGDALFVHSPTPLTPALRDALAALGEVRWIVGPNRIHYWWIPEWQAAYPRAETWLAPRIREQAGARIDFDARELGAAQAYPWEAAIATLPIAGRYMTEVEFFHRASRTLVLTDLVENFEPHKLESRWMRWMAWLGGALAPHGGMPRDMRMTYPRATLRAAVETMLAWEPERVILAHGRWFEREGAAELRRAFAWLLDG